MSSQDTSSGSDGATPGGRVRAAVTRRRFLAASATIGALAGCAGGGDGGDGADGGDGGDGGSTTTAPQTTTTRPPPPSPMSMDTLDFSFVPSTATAPQYYLPEKVHCQL
jgi:hypothetical protein